MRIKNITKFEHQNPEFSVNVYHVTNNDDYKNPVELYISKNENRKYQADLLLIDDFANNRTHYALITNLGSLLYNHGRYTLSAVIVEEDFIYKNK